MVARYFDTSKFVANAIGTFGNSGKNMLRGPRFFNTDVASAEGNEYRGAGRLQFRAEFFNIFNNVNFNAPNSNVSSAQFGRITSALDPRIVQFGVNCSFEPGAHLCRVRSAGLQACRAPKKLRVARCQHKCTPGLTLRAEVRSAYPQMKRRGPRPTPFRRSFYWSWMPPKSHSVAPFRATDQLPCASGVLSSSVGALGERAPGPHFATAGLE